MRLIAFLLCSLPVLADPPFLPVAQCDGKHCVLSQADYDQLRAFVGRAVKAAQASQEQSDLLEQQLIEAQRKLIRNAYCQSQRT